MFQNKGKKVWKAYHMLSRFFSWHFILRLMVFKVRIFWEGHTIWKSSTLSLTLLSSVKFQVEDFFKFCGLLRISKLNLHIGFSNINTRPNKYTTKPVRFLYKHNTQKWPNSMITLYYFIKTEYCDFGNIKNFCNFTKVS